MILLQLKVDEKLKKAMDDKAASYGVPTSSLVRIVLVKTFMENKKAQAGNIFNAERDSGGKGIKIDDIIAML